MKQMEYWHGQLLQQSQPELPNEFQYGLVYKVVPYLKPPNRFKAM